MTNFAKTKDELEQLKYVILDERQSSMFSLIGKSKMNVNSSKLEIDKINKKSESGHRITFLDERLKLSTINERLNFLLAGK